MEETPYFSLFLKGCSRLMPSEIRYAAASSFFALIGSWPAKENCRGRSPSIISDAQNFRKFQVVGETERCVLDVRDRERCRMQNTSPMTFPQAPDTVRQHFGSSALRERFVIIFKSHLGGAIV